MLAVESLSRSFGGVEALSAVDLTVEDGDVLGLIGPNGSGKTTFFNVVTGVYPPSHGRILLNGNEITGIKPAEIMARGVARTFQNLRIYPRMTVFENIWASQSGLANVSMTDLLFATPARERPRREQVRHLLRCTGLIDREDDMAAALPLPGQRRLELARALAREPDLLLLDEPAGGMTPAETEAMAKLIDEIAVPGRTCIIIEHKMDMISALCNRLCVLNFGRKIADGKPDAVLNDPGVVEAYIGRDP